jgi:hypothetical protein
MHAPNDRSDFENGPPSSRRNAPTLPPAALTSVMRLKPDAPVNEPLDCLSVGDEGGAYEAAQALFDGDLIPALAVPNEALSSLLLGYREDLFLSGVDGCASLVEVASASGLDPLDAARALLELLAKGVIALR